MEKIKESISVLNIAKKYWTPEEKETYSPLLSLAEDVIHIGGMVEKKGLFGDTPQSELIKRCGFNEGREQTIKAVAEKMQGLRKVIADFMEFDPAEEAWYMYNDGAVKDLAQAIRKHLIGEEHE